METLGRIFLDLGAALIFAGCIFYIVDRIRARRRKFSDFINGLKMASQVLEKVKPYTTHGILHFRDKTGKLCKIEIMVDPTLEEEEPDDSWEKIENIHMPREGSLDQAERVVFSSQAAANIVARGESLDETVMKMLRAAGRID